MRIYDLLPSIHERLKTIPQNEIDSLRADMRDKYNEVKCSKEFFENTDPAEITIWNKAKVWAENPFVRGLMVFAYIFLLRWMLEMIHPELFKGKESEDKEDEEKSAF